MGSRSAVVALLLLLLLVPSTVAAEPWVTAEVPAALAVSDAQAETFRGGAMPALGLYGRLTPWVALAARGRVGALGNAPRTMDSSTRLADPRWGGVGTVSVAVRVGSAPWIEGAAGGAVTGTDIVPAFEVGVGWLAHVGSVDVGPSLRYLHLRSADGPGLGAAGILLLGVELRRAPPRRSSPPARVAARSPATAVAVATPRDPDALIDVTGGCAGEPDGCEDAARDVDVVVDVLETCAILSAALAGGGDGCAAGSPIEVHPDRIVLSEQVLFAVSRARVRRGARPVLRAIAAAWKRGGWQHLTIEGHADVRGDPARNQWLAALRAERVRAALIDAGVPAEAIDTVGLGATRPRSPHDHDLNRRVEFVTRHQAAEVQR